MKKKWLIFILCGLLIIPVIYPLFTPYVLGTADGLAHKFRLVSFNHALSSGILRPRWLSEQALGFGSPIFLFNYLLPYYVIAGITRLGFSVNLSTQIYTALTLVSSFVAMYLLVSRLWGRAAGLVAATVYTWAPYHLLTIYLYEGWGEMTAFIFPPLLLYLILLLFSLRSGKKFQAQNFYPPYEKRKELLVFILLVGCWVLFILSHNVSVLMFSPVILVSAFIICQLNFWLWMRIVWAFGWAITISAFFWLPAVILNNQTVYPALIAKEMAMRGSYFKSLTALLNVAYSTIQKGTVGYYDFTVGLPIFTAILLGILYTMKYLFIHSQREIKENAPRAKFSHLLDNWIIGLLVFLFFSLYLSNYSSNWFWNLFTPLRFIVYPFRFLSLATFAGSMLVGWFGSKNKVLAIFFVVLAVIAGRPYTNPSIDQFPFTDEYFKQTQTVVYAPETHKNMATTEFLPKWVDQKFLAEQEQKYFATGQLPEKFVFPDGAGEVIESERGMERMKAKLEVAKSERLIINTFYFPNWQAKLDGKSVVVSRDSEGRMGVDVSEGRHQLELVFGTTNIEMIGNLISIGGLILFLIVIYRFRYFIF